MDECNGTGQGDTEERGELAFRNPIKREGWAQIYHVMTLDQNLSDGAFRLYALLLRYARQDSDCWPGRERLARDMDRTVRTIDRYLAELVKGKFITREQRLNTTAKTWIEDLEVVYQVDPDKNDRDVPDRDDGDASEPPVPDTDVGDVPDRDVRDMSLTKMAGKEHAEDETDINDDGGSQQKQAIMTLTGFGVDRAVAKRIARKRTLADVQAWIAYASDAQGLRKPVAFVVRRLLDGDAPPQVKRERDAHHDRHRYIQGKYAEFIRH